MPSFKTTLPKPLFWVLLAIAFLNCSKLLKAGFQPDNPSDFRTLYLGQKLLANGENPYSDQQLKARWQQTVKTEKLHSEQAPGFPETPLVYPPWALVLFMPFSLLFYKVAYWLWYAVLPLLLFGILKEVQAFCKTNFNSGLTILDLLVVALAFKNTIPALLVGQPMFLCLWLGFMALNLAPGKKVGSGILLGLAAFKITLALPFLLYMLFRKEWKILGITAITVFLLTGIAFWLSPDPLVMVESYQQTVAQLRQSVFAVSGNELPYFMPLLTEMGTLLVYLFPKTWPYLSVFYALLIGGSLYTFQRKGGFRNEGLMFVFAALLTLLCTYHLLYDCLILLPLIPFILNLPASRKIMAGLVSSVLFLPVNGVLQALHLPAAFNVLYFSTPVALFALLGLLLYYTEPQPATAKIPKVKN